jgi:hypothetical protein
MPRLVPAAVFGRSIHRCSSSSISRQRPQRYLWTAVTLSSSSAEALEAAAVAQLSKHSNASHVFAALSKSLPEKTLSSTVSLLREHHPSFLGCLCDSILDAPFQEPLLAHTVSLAFYEPSSSSKGAHTVVPFKSTIVGKPKIALGREIKPDMDYSRDAKAPGSDLTSLYPQEDWGKLWGYEGGEDGNVPELDGLEYVLCRMGVFSLNGR